MLQHGVFLAVLTAASLVLGCGASKQIGKGVAEGVTSKAAEEHREHPHQAPGFEQIGSGVVRGALQALDEPEAKARLDRLSALLAQGALAGATGVAGQGRAAYGGGPTAEGPPLSTLGSQFAQGLTYGLTSDLESDSSLARGVAWLVRQAAADATTGAGQALVAQVGPEGNGPLARGFAGAASVTARAAAHDAFAELTGCEGHDSACLEARTNALSQSIGRGLGAGILQALRIPALVVAFLIGAIAAFFITWAAMRVRRRETG